MNRYVSFLSVVLFVTSCHASISEEGLTISLFSRPDLKWTWVESGKEEIAQKTVLYEELFGTRNSLRLNQSMSVFKERAFCFNDGDECRVIDLSEKKQIVSLSLPEKSHHNNAQFLSTYYDTGDKYPLLLLSRGDYPPNQNDFYIIRVQEENDCISFSTVKTVHNCILEARNNGSWVIDEEHGKLYLYCMSLSDWRVKENNRFCVFSFHLPDLHTSEAVTLDYGDVLEKWEYTYLIHQGGTYYNGYLFFNVQELFSIAGRSVLCPKCVIAINVDNGRIEALLPLDDHKETEGISIFNDLLFLSFKNGSENQASEETVFTLSQYTLPASILKKN